MGRRFKRGFAPFAIWLLLVSLALQLGCRSRPSTLSELTSIERVFLDPIRLNEAVTKFKRERPSEFKLKPLSNLIKSQRAKHAWTYLSTKLMDGPYCKSELCRILPLHREAYAIRDRLLSCDEVKFAYDRSLALWQEYGDHFDRFERIATIKPLNIKAVEGVFDDMEAILDELIAIDINRFSKPDRTLVYSSSNRVLDRTFGDWQGFLVSKMATQVFAQPDASWSIRSPFRLSDYFKRPPHSDEFQTYFVQEASPVDYCVDDWFTLMLSRAHGVRYNRVVEGGFDDDPRNMETIELDIIHIWTPSLQQAEHYKRGVYCHRGDCRRWLLQEGILR